MLRRALFSLYQGRIAANHTRDPRLRPPKCTDRVSGSGLRPCLVNHRVFGTSGASLCEQKKDGERTEEPQVESRVRDDVEDDRVKCEVKVGGLEKSDEALVKALCDKSAEGKETRPEVMSQNTAEIPVSDPTSAVAQKTAEKTGKQGLLELLGAMKVDTTTKTKLKSFRKVTSEQESVGKLKRVVMEKTSNMFQQATASHSASLSPELVAAASAAASTLPDRSRAESELLKQLRKHEAVSEEKRRTETQNIGSIIADMKVGKKPVGRLNSWPANQIRFDDDGRGYTHDRGITGELAEIRRRNSAFTAKRLNIFSAADQNTQSDLVVGPSLWDSDLANQIVRAVNQRPRNGFEEMIQWTREGKLWSYPIDNQAGMKEEVKVPFHEHVFLQRHLEDGFPQHGPVRHFMELVVTGLSKNHHLTVTEKLEHIAWFRDYFLQKQEILSEAEA
ncbi:28S ribosomal protein S31, mitochondrial [Neoarius graeffei]|uniref:28S ribosomal protein S31, mitochondrial n=1 Tax=Neoarius graeffei TaxID=443677 RepID=UPI00298C8C3D|nr:28S ribosomal protein S31, mitochondrial [Neoarius graeffei]